MSIMTFLFLFFYFTFLVYFLFSFSSYSFSLFSFSIFFLSFLSSSFILIYSRPPPSRLCIGQRTPLPDSSVGPPYPLVGLPPLTGFPRFGHGRIDRGAEGGGAGADAVIRTASPRPRAPPPPSLGAVSCMSPWHDSRTSFASCSPPAPSTSRSRRSPTSVVLHQQRPFQLDIIYLPPRLR